MTGHQATRRPKRPRKINFENTAKRDNPTNKVSPRVKRMGTTHLKAHLKTVSNELQNREQITMQRRDKRNILETKAFIPAN